MLQSFQSSAGLVSRVVGVPINKFIVLQFFNIIQYIVYIVQTQLIIAAAIQFKIRPIWQQTKRKSSQSSTVHKVLTVRLVFSESQHKY